MYFDLGHVVLLLMAGVAAGIWWQLRELKERAYQAAKAHCDQVGVQLLDYNVCDSQWRIVRDRPGRLTLQRSYQFEFTSTGDERYSGRVEMVGQRVITVQLEPHRI